MTAARPRILIVGSTGQVGVELKRSFAGAGEIFERDRSQVDVTKPDEIRAMVRSVAPDIVLNAAAYTAVDRAETERETANAVNAVAPGVLAEEALRHDALLVHFSTDYVFDGSKRTAWIETDSPKPLSIYGASKLAGDRAIEQVGGKYLIFRTSWVYGPHGKNFLFTMLRLGHECDQLKIVDDQVGGPTTSCELADATYSIVTSVLSGKHGAAENWSGLYNMTCSGSVSWCGFARAILERAGGLLKGKQPEIVPIPTSAYPTPAARPAYSVLSNEKLQTRFAVKLRPWEDALENVLFILKERVG
ncbi:MAG: dTDP-4-dehydrorhamnose reductase [Terracidiphilus sp.]